MKTRADDYTLIASPRNCCNRNLGTDGRTDGRLYSVNGDDNNDWIMIAIASIATKESGESVRSRSVL